MEHLGSVFPPRTHTPKLEIEEVRAYVVDDIERLPYQLLRNLGHGHSGNVEEVKDINTGRVFARKRIRIPGGRSGKDKKKIFDNEIQIIRNLTGHHHVIQVFATYVSKYEVCLMLYPVADEGDLERFLESFSQSLSDCKSPDISDTNKAKVDILKRSFGCLACGLEFMHQRKIRHKDIKPRNILVHRGSVIYTDFGYSLDSSLDDCSTTTGRPDFLTRRYSAPEVVDFKPRNSRSDVFSLGCVFIDVLSTLTKVLDGDSNQCYYECMNSIHTQMSCSNIPTPLRFLIKIIISMTLANPAERSTATDVAGKLREYPGFLCDQCQEPQITKLSLRRSGNMIESDDTDSAASNLRSLRHEASLTFTDSEESRIAREAEMDSTSLWSYMNNHMVQYKFGGLAQEFLPKSALDKVTTRQAIKQIIAEDEDLVFSSQGETEFVTRVYLKGRKLFATCFFCDMPMTCLKALLDKGITDKDIPLTRAQCPGKKFERRFVNGFLAHQGRFHIPFFGISSIQSLDDHFTMPIDFNESVSNRLGRGTFSDVWRVGIHPDHHSFSNVRLYHMKTLLRTDEAVKGINRTDRFAMKVIQHEGSIQREKSFIQAMAGLSHAHLVTCLAGWIFDSKFYMIYELASCNLEEFMQRRKETVQNPGLTESMFVKQLCGLAAAVLVIHCQGKPETPKESNLLSVKPNESKRTGYIHDLKPENILVFMEDSQVHSFRLSDFSCARVVDYIESVSVRQSHLTTSKLGTPIYRAPESLTSKGTSRPYDLWSLGCIYLELLVWFFDGYRALEYFRDDRLGLEHPHGTEDKGFYFREGSNTRLQLREPVIKMIEELLARSQGNLREIVNTIPSLLKIEPKERLTAVQLVDKLKKLDTGADFTVDSAAPNSLLVQTYGPRDL